jgi:hypothetical protein
MQWRDPSRGKPGGPFLFRHPFLLRRDHTAQLGGDVEHARRLRWRDNDSLRRYRRRPQAVAGYVRASRTAGESYAHNDRRSFCDRVADGRGRGDRLGN